MTLAGIRVFPTQVDRNTQSRSIQSGYEQSLTLKPSVVFDIFCDKSGHVINGSMNFKIKFDFPGSIEIDLL